MSNDHLGRALIWAHTPAGGMPPFINITEHPGDIVCVTVRSAKKPPGKLPYESVGDVAEIDLPMEVYLDMLGAMQAAVARKAQSA